MAHHGLVTECLQYFIPGRSFDFADLGADLSGVVAASLLSHVAFYARLKDFSVALSKK
jgi:VanZ family protein